MLELVRSVQRGGVDARHVLVGVGERGAGFLAEDGRCAAAGNGIEEGYEPGVGEDETVGRSGRRQGIESENGLGGEGIDDLRAVLAIAAGGVPEVQPAAASWTMGASAVTGKGRVPPTTGGVNGRGSDSTSPTTGARERGRGERSASAAATPYVMDIAKKRNRASPFLPSYQKTVGVFFCHALQPPLRRHQELD